MRPKAGRLGAPLSPLETHCRERGQPEEIHWKLLYSVGKVWLSWSSVSPSRPAVKGLCYGATPSSRMLSVTLLLYRWKNEGGPGW